MLSQPNQLFLMLSISQRQYLMELGRDQTRAALGVKHTKFIAALKGFCGKPRSRPVAPPLASRRLPLAPSHCVGAASGWRSHALVPQHSGPFPGRTCPPGPYPATNGREHQVHPPCRSSRSAAHSVRSLLMSKALASKLRRAAHCSAALLVHPSCSIGRLQ